MKYSCNLIRDLLPLYCDRICSEDSAEAVQAHISTCAECKNIYTVMQQKVSMDSAVFEKRQLASMKKVKEKIKKRNTIFATIGTIVGILFVVIVIRVMLMIGVISFAVQDGWKDNYISTDINDYGIFEGFGGYSKLDIFPEQLTDNIKIHDYSYYYADTFLDPTAQIYLECSYEKDDYLKEIERLKGIQEEYEDRIQTIVYDTDSFSYPAYVTIDADNHCYEYALLLGEERIAYVFLQFIREEDIVFPTEYLPKEYEQKKTGYSIYVFKNQDGDGHCVSVAFFGS